MRHESVGLPPMLLYGPNGLISSTNFKLKSTGKPTSGVKMIPLNGTYGRFGLQVVSASTVATSGFTITLIGSLTSQNLGKVGSSKYSNLVQATSANLGAIKFSTAIIPASFVGIRSTKFTTAAGRALQVRLVCVPS